MEPAHVQGADGVNLAVQLDGDPSAPPIVLLHALGETSQSWEPLVPALADRYRVAAFDLRGHGASDWPGSYSTQLMCDDVITAVDTFGFTNFSLVGHSLGGVVALLIAERLGARVSRLVLEEAVPPYPREPRVVPNRPAETEAALSFDWAVLEAAYTEMTDPTMRGWPALVTITAPTLVVAGGPSSHIPAERIAEMAAFIPQCEVVTIDAGHHVHLNAPGEFSDIVLSWLGDGTNEAPATT